MRILLTGGGSGGHLNTSLALAEYLQRKEPKIYEQLIFIGGTKGMQGEQTGSIESRKIPERGIKFFGISSGKLHRPVNLKTLSGLLGSVWGIIESYRIIRREKPEVVFSTGGFVTVPVVIAAFLRGVPVVIHEQTLTAGLANRVAAKFAKKILVTFPQPQKGFPQGKVIHTGNPIRASRFGRDLPTGLDKDVETFLKQVETHSKVGGKFIFMTGGGLGSHRLNVWAGENLAKLAELGMVLLQAGENSVNNDLAMLEKVRSSLPDHLQQRVKVVKWFGDEIGFIYTYADIVIARPGANTVLELLAREKKAAFVPIAWAAGGEQQKNAEYFCANQEGQIVEQLVIDQELLPAVESLVDKQAKPSAHLVKQDAVESIWRELQAICSSSR